MTDMPYAESERLAISLSPTEEELEQLGLELDRFNRVASNDRIHFPADEEPGLVLKSAVRGPTGDIVGGLCTSSLLGVMWLEVLWTDAAHRGRGIASWLVLEAERIAHERGCVGAGTWTFDWQGADFYPRIGFELNGVYDGYPRGMTEHVLSKPLPSPKHVRDAVARRVEENRRCGYELVTSPTEDEVRVAHRGLREHCVAHVGDGDEYGGVPVRVVLRDGAGRLAGGLTATTPVHALALDGIWIDERFRGAGHGRRLIEEAERVAKSQGCGAVQGCCLSFQSREFFHKVGYESFGRVDVYPDGVWEDLLIKRL
jgi:GNAT superfamily N-acetyltransferase